MTETLKRTALYQWHVDHGGRMVPFAGWEMPVQYPTGPIEEHNTTRRSAGLFDIDHMGQMDVRGPDAEALVNRLVTHDVRQMKLFDAHYALMCYADGGIVDDLFVYKLPDRSDETGRPYFFLVINASSALRARKASSAFSMAMAAWLAKAVRMSNSVFENACFFEV